MRYENFWGDTQDACVEYVLLCYSEWHWDASMLPVRNLRNICNTLLSVHSSQSWSISMSQCQMLQGRAGGDYWLSPDRTSEKWIMVMTKKNTKSQLFWKVWDPIAGGDSDRYWRSPLFHPNCNWVLVSPFLIRLEIFLPGKIWCMLYTWWIRRQTHPPYCLVRDALKKKSIFLRIFVWKCLNENLVSKTPFSFWATKSQSKQGHVQICQRVWEAVWCGGEYKSNKNFLNIKLSLISQTFAF